MAEIKTASEIRELQQAQAQSPDEAELAALLYDVGDASIHQNIFSMVMAFTEQMDDEDKLMVPTPTLAYHATPSRAYAHGNLLDGHGFHRADA